MYSSIVVFLFSSRRRHTRSSTVSWGSEMCIRDRVFRRDVLDVVIDGKDRLARIVNFRRADLLKFWNCLLYTSDAAAQRSSVDLGGPSIIKKKKAKYQ